MADFDQNHTSFVSGAKTGDLETEELAQSVQLLGEEVLRISDRLATLLNARRTPAEPGQENLPEKLAEIIEARKERGRIFSASLFSDPAWDILLHLLSAELNQFRISFARLAERANVPPSSANRWIAIMVDKGMVVRHDDRLDARRTFLDLHPNTSAALRRLIAGPPSPRGM